VAHRCGRYVQGRARRPFDGHDAPAHGHPSRAPGAPHRPRPHVVQRGSNITPERLRFDFSHPSKLTPEQIAEVERIVNENIARDWPMTWREVPTDEAFAEGAIGAFGDKYGETVKVYTAGDPDGLWYSKEICGGPHVERTGSLGRFRITKEESSSAGVRRIRAVLE